MKSNRRIVSKTLAFLLITCIAVSSCYESIEDCLDSSAENFNVYADENCCCTYPTLNINIIKEFDGESFSVSDTFVDAVGHRFLIQEQSFYISNISLTYADGSTSSVIDTLERVIPQSSGNTVIIEDNFGLVRQNTPSYVAGDIGENGDVTQVNLLVGLTDEINMLIPDQMPTSHALGSNNAADHYIDGEGYVFIRWKLKQLDIAGIDEILIVLSGSDSASNVAISADVTFIPGQDSQLPLVVDYGKWLEGIDFAADLSIAEARIISNTPNAFNIQ